MKKTLIYSVVVVLLVAAFAFTSCSAPPATPTPSPTPAPAPTPQPSAKTYELVFSSFLTAENPVDIMKLYMSEVEKRSQGRIKFQQHWSGTLIKAPDHYDGIRTGVADIGMPVMSYTPGVFPLSDGMSLPFDVKNNEQFQKIIRDVYFNMPEVQKEFSEVHSLYHFIPGLFQLHTTGKQVRKMADSKGLQVRSPGGAVSMLVKAWGATPVSMPMSESYVALQKGIVDAITCPYEAMMTGKLGELATYHVEGNFCGNSLFMCMNKDSYASLPDDLKKIIDDTAYEWWVVAGQMNDQIDSVAKKWCLDRGNKAYVIPESERAEWDNASASVRQQWIKEMEDKGLAGQKYVDTVMELKKKYPN